MVRLVADHFEITGAPHDLEVLLPDPQGRVAIKIGYGAGDVTLLRPPGVAARLRVVGSASHLTFDDSEFSGLVGSAQLR